MFSESPARFRTLKRLQLNNDETQSQFSCTMSVSAASQQHKAENQPLATLRISHLVIATLPFRGNLV